MKARHEFANSTEYEKYLRVYFSAMALQGYIAAGSNGMPEPEQLACYAKETADALIKALNETK